MRTDILQQAQAIRDSMDAAAIALTDEQAVKSPRLYPTWAAELAVKAGDRLYYPATDRLYKVVSDHITQADWTPDATPALWVVVSIDEYPEWVQPTGAHDAYAAGAKVKHNGKRWVSDVDNNTWAPGTYGWTEVTA